MEKYNGWTNHSTWLTNLHYDNFFQEEAQQHYDDAEGAHNVRLVNATNSLADYIKETIEEFAEEAQTGVSAFFADIINSTLSEVNWREIAGHYIDDINKEDAA